MSDKNSIDKRNDISDKLISIDKEDIDDIIGGIRIGGIDYKIQEVTNELEEGPVEVKIKI